MKLFMVRHGQTTANVANLLYGQMEFPLTEMGQKQAEAIRPILAKHKFDRVYSSDLGRAIETQRIALPGVEGIRTPLLREINIGKLTGLTYTEAEETYPEEIKAARVAGYDWFGGESHDDLLARMRAFLDMLEADPCENVIAFSHRGMLGFMLQVVLGCKFSRSLTLSSNCAIQVFEFDGSRWKLLAWNYMMDID
ncbi:MAG: histidine phosphatase family protein [Oscillospiraceae bacterium]|nr:histidine phosphatase family protein [Oscillospiraceae bacterium]